MGYATLLTGMNWIRGDMLSCEEAEILERVNDIRQHFYLMYQYLPLFLDAVRCFEVQDFATDCGTGCYQGITLPRDMETPEAIWWQRTPLTLRSGWREWQTGISPECSCSYEAIDMGSAFPTEREPDANYRGKLKVVAIDPQDAGKTVILRGIDAFGIAFEETVVLGTEPKNTVTVIRSLSAPGGIVKDQTVGQVIISQHNGRVLSRLEPDETVPSYRRLKITGIPDGCRQINVRAARRFFPMTDITDVIETDNKVAFQEMARFIRLNSKLNKEGGDVATARMHYAQAKTFMIGDKARSEGKSAQREIRIQTPRMTPSKTLRGRSRW